MRSRTLPLALLVVLLLPVALAANDPGHDTLYIEQTGDSNLSGNLNITDELSVVDLIYSQYLELLGNNTQPAGSFAQIYSRSAGQRMVLNAPTALELIRDSGTLVQVGPPGAASATLNVSGIIYEQNTRICLANGTNCLTSNNTGNISRVLAGNGISVSAEFGPIVTVSTNANTCSSTEYSYWDGDSWECRADQGAAGGDNDVAAGWDNSTEGSIQIVNTADNVSAGSLLIDNTNNRVGLRTANPAAPIHLYVTGNGESIVFGPADGTNNGMTFYPDYTDNVSIIQVGPNNSHPYSRLYLSRTSTVSTNFDELRIHADDTYMSGNLGIGIITPGNELEVIGTINATAIQVGTENVCQEDGTNCPAGISAPSSGLTNQSVADGDIVQTNTAANVTLGNSLVHIDSTKGRVGINTTNPRDKFDIRGGAFNLYLNGTNVGIIFGDTGAGADVKYSQVFTNDGRTQWRGLADDLTEGVLGVTIDLSTGHFGINDTTPTETLSVYGQTNITEGLTITGRTSNSNGRIDLFAGDRANQWRLQNTQSTGAFIIRDQANDENPITIQNNTPTNTLYLDSTGRVGIGNSSPSGPLHISANANSSQIVKIENKHNGIAAASVLRLQNNFTTEYFDIAVTADGGVFDDQAILSIGPNLSGLNIFVNNTNVLWIDGSTKFLGIGTQTPGNELEVIGTINATDIQIGNTQLCQSDGTNCPAGAGAPSSGLTNQSVADGDIVQTNVAANVTLGNALLHIDNTNRVIGVNTTTPTMSSGTTGGINIVHNNTAELHLHDSDEGTTSTDGANFALQGTTLFINNRENGPTTFWVNGSERARIDGQGNVGIGTSAPDARLVVNGTIGSGNVFLRSANNGRENASTAHELTFIVQGANDGAAQGLGSIVWASEDSDFSTTSPKRVAYIGALAGETYAADNDGSSRLVFGTAPDDPGVTDDVAIERMRIDESGNVGIGTATPRSLLEVEDASNVIVYFNSSGDAAVQLRLQSDSSNRRIVADAGSGTADTQIIFDGDGILFTGTTSSTDEIMRLNDTTGSVGIGTESPVGRLHVLGASTGSTGVDDFRVEASNTTASAGTGNSIAMLAGSNNAEVTSGTGGQGGSISLTGGKGANASESGTAGNGGHINITAGNAGELGGGGGSGTAGNIYIVPGYAEGSSDGSVFIAGQSESTTLGALIVTGDELRVTGGATPSVATGEGDLYVSGNLEVDTELELDGNLDVDGVGLHTIEGTVRFSTNALAIDGAGNVGVGTISPADLDGLAETILMVGDSNNPRAIINHGGTEWGELLFMNTSNQTWGVGGSSGSNDRFYLYNYLTETEVITVTDDNLVGIGNATPTTALQVASGRLQVTGNTVPTGGTGVELGHSSVAGVLLSYNRTGNQYKAMRYNALSHELEINGTDFLVVSGDSKVGIGTATPNNLLTIYEGSPSAAEVLLNVSTNGGSRFSVNEDGRIASGDCNLLATGFCAQSSGTSALIAIDTDTTTQDAAIVLRTSTGGDTWVVGVDGSDAHRFKIADWGSLGTQDVFQIEAGAPNDAFYIDSSGEVGVSDATPDQILDLQGTNPQALMEESTTEFLRVGVGETSDTPIIGFDDGDELVIGEYSSPTDTTIVEFMRIDTNGNVGIGDSDPESTLHIRSSSGPVMSPTGGLNVNNTNVPSGFLVVESGGGTRAAAGIILGPNSQDDKIVALSSSYQNGVGNGVGHFWISTRRVPTDVNLSGHTIFSYDGDVGIRDGGLCVGDDDNNIDCSPADGSIYYDVSAPASYDLAEEIPYAGELDHGDVVVVGSGNETVERTSIPYDARVVGVITTTPNLVFRTSENGYSSLGDSDASITETHAPLTIAGRVPVKVTNENGIIENGDLLTTSSTPGHAMKYAPLDPDSATTFEELKVILKENERRRHSILGKALEPCTAGSCVIKAIVDLH